MSYFLIQPFITISTFFYSIIKDINSKDSTYKTRYVLLIHILYIICISILFGFFLSIVFLSMIIVFLNIKFEIGLINVASIIMLLFVFLCSIVIQSFKIDNFNLPERFLNSFYIINDYIKSKYIWKAVVFIICISLLMFIAFVLMISNLPITQNIIETVLIFLLLISFLLGFYSYYIISPKVEIIKRLKEFTLWLIFCSILISISIIRGYIILKTDMSKIGIFDAIIIIIGGLGVIKELPDSWNKFYIEFLKYYSLEMDNIWVALQDKYSYHILLNKILTKKREVKKDLYYIKSTWQNGNKKNIIYAIIMAIFLLIFTFFIGNSNKIYILINQGFSYIWTFLINLTGNEKNANNAIFLIILLIALCCQIVFFIREFKISNSKRKLVLINRFLLLMIIFIASIYSTLNIIMPSYLLYFFMAVFIYLIISYKCIRLD